MHSYLPIIDISGRHDAAQALAIGQRIDAACREFGFFYIVGHGASGNLRRQLFEASKAFFDLPLQVKQRCSAKQHSHRRGFEAIGHQALDSGKPADLLEAFNIGSEGNGTTPNCPRHGPNQWPTPDIAPSLQANASAYMQAMLQLSKEVMELIALGLGLPREYFDSYAQNPFASMRLLHYPPRPANAEPEQLGCGSHTDWGALTLLAQDDMGGLQVQSADGLWHNVQPVPDSFIVNLGDLMARWTNGRYRSTVHRVSHNTAARSRYSIPYFFDIDYHARVSALPGCFDAEHPPLHPPTTAGLHHAEKLAAARSGYQ